MTDEKLTKLRYEIIQAEKIKERITILENVVEHFKGSSVEKIQIFNKENNPNAAREWITYYLLGFETQAEMDSWFKDMIADRLDVLLDTVKEEYRKFEIE